MAYQSKCILEQPLKRSLGAYSLLEGEHLSHCPLNNAYQRVSFGGRFLNNIMTWPNVITAENNLILKLIEIELGKLNFPVSSYSDPKTIPSSNSIRAQSVFFKKFQISETLSVIGLVFERFSGQPSHPGQGLFLPIERGVRR